MEYFGSRTNIGGVKSTWRDSGAGHRLVVCRPEMQPVLAGGVLRVRGKRRGGGMIERHGE